MKKLLLVLALAAFAPLGYADDDGKEVEQDQVASVEEHDAHEADEADEADKADEIAKTIETIIANNGIVSAKETAKAVKELKQSVREAVLEGVLTRLEGSNALNGLEIALGKGGQNPVSPS